MLEIVGSIKIEYLVYSMIVMFESIVIIKFLQ